MCNFVDNIKLALITLAHPLPFLPLPPLLSKLRFRPLAFLGIDGGVQLFSLSELSLKQHFKLVENYMKS